MYIVEQYIYVIWPGYHMSSCIGSRHLYTTTLTCVEVGFIFTLQEGCPGYYNGGGITRGTLLIFSLRSKLSSNLWPRRKSIIYFILCFGFSPSRTYVGSLELSYELDPALITCCPTWDTRFRPLMSHCSDLILIGPDLTIFLPRTATISVTLLTFGQ